MRLILVLFIIAQLASQCKKRDTIADDKCGVVLQFIRDEITQNKMDIRIYEPPPPPELKDSTNHSGSFRHDSIINNLELLTIYINDSIRNGLIDRLPGELLKEFSFLDSIAPSLEPPIRLDIGSIPERKGIILKSIHFGEFQKMQQSLRNKEGYGGFITIQNLYFSKNGKKAYFEIHFFKDKLNATTKSVFANWKNGKWEYTEKLRSIS